MSTVYFSDLSLTDVILNQESCVTRQVQIHTGITFDVHARAAGVFAARICAAH